MSAARTHFHVALALVFIPVFSLPVVLVLLLVNLLNRVPGDEHRRWTRALLWLFVLDLALAPVFVVLMMNRETQTRGLSGPVAVVKQPARIGVAFESADPGAEARISQVVPGWPAERAGILAGDRITAVDDVPVRTVAEMKKEIEGSLAGVARRIAIDRKGGSIRIDVVPWTPAGAGEDSLFHPMPGAFDLKAVLRDPWWWGAATLLALAAWGWSRRRPGPRVRVWRGLVAALVVTMAGVIATAWLLYRIQGGWSAGAALVALLAQTLFMLAGAWAGRRLCGPAEPLTADPRLSTVKTVLLGLLYHLTGLVRVSLIVLAIDRFLLGGAGGPGETGLDQLRVMAGTGLGVLLFILPVVLVGPLAEEALFRGFLLPRLTRAVGMWLALAVSSAFFGVIHTHLGMYVVVVAYLGWVFGWARLRSGGIAAPVILHVLHNGFVTAVAFLR